MNFSKPKRIALSTQRRGEGLIVLSTLGYGFFSVFTRGIQSSGLSPLDIALWRFVLAAVIMWAIVGLRRTRSPALPIPRRWVLFSGPLLAAAALSAFYGLALIPASVFLLLYYSYPAMVAFMSALRGERLPPAVWLALGVTLLGVAVSAPNLSDGLHGASLQGVGLALFNAFVVALFFIVSSDTLHGYSDAPRATAWSLTGTLTIMLLLIPFRSVAVPNSPTVWANLIGLVLVSTLMPIVALSGGIRLIGAVRASLISMVEPVLSLLFAFVLLGDRLTLNQVLGGGLILASVVFIQLRGALRGVV